VISRKGTEREGYAWVSLEGGVFIGKEKKSKKRGGPARKVQHQVRGRGSFNLHLHSKGPVGRGWQ